MKYTLIIVLFLLSTALGATTYYISPTGSDSNSGSSSSPWKTLAYACSKATVSGDIIHVNAGTYTETSQSKLAVGVSIVGEGVTSYIKSTYAATLSNDNDGSIVLTSSSSSATNGNQSISYIKLDGSGLVATRAIAVNYRNNVSIHHCTLVDFNYSGISINGSTSSYPAVTSSRHDVNTQIYSNNITNCSHGPTSPNYNYGSIISAGQQDLQVYDNTIEQKSRASGLNGEMLNFIWTKGAKIYNNTLNRNNYDANNWNFYSEIFFTEGGVEVYNNVFNGSATLDFVDVRKGSYAFGIKIYNNKFMVPTQVPTNEHGIQAINFEERGAVQDVYVYNNHFKNVNTGVQFDGLATNTDKILIDGKIRMDHIYVHYNIFENIGNTTNNYSSAINIKPEGSTTNLVWDNIHINNNTIISGATNKAYSGIMVETGGTMTNICIRNNIIKGVVTYPVYFSYNLPSTISGSTFFVQNNLYHANSNNSIGYNGVTISGMNISTPTPADPLFVSTSDFRLQAASPAIGKGLPVVGLTTDFAGNTVKSPPSIGAYESGSSTTPPAAAMPVIQTSVVDNATPSLVQLTYDLTLATTKVPAVTSFSVLVNGTARTVSSVAVVTNKVQLTLSSAIKYGDIITVSYTKPATNPLQTDAGGSAASFSSKTTTNNVASTSKDALPVTITMTISPSYVHTTINIALAYSSVLTQAQITAMTPQIVRITDSAGKLYVEKAMATGATSAKFAINLRRGYYNVVLLTNGVQAASKKVMVY
jgi:uncharacterized repeat protein (TIGR02059 family)